MKLTSKGQVTIPQQYRQRFGIFPQTEVVFAEIDGHLVIEPAISRKDAFKGWMDRARGTANTHLSSDEITHQTRGES